MLRRYSTNYALLAYILVSSLGCSPCQSDLDCVKGEICVEGDCEVPSTQVSESGTTQDSDGDGVSYDDGDCDDNDPKVGGDARWPCDAGDPSPCAVGELLCVNGAPQCVRPPANTTEVCNGIDDNCNGLTDESDPGGGNPCSTGLPGECTNGISHCTNGILACIQNKNSKAETCNGLDDDCDGSVDENMLNACGKCGPLPSETCNSIDDDCDGLVDEGVKNACGSCGSVPSEICNSIDDDCDGLIDEGVKNACGKCGALPSETCNSIDDDCDGLIDEGLPLNACGKCGPLPSESCNAIDDDCDGKIDEGLSNCGLTYNCSSFSFNTASGSGSVSVALPSGATFVPIVEVRSHSTGGEDDGAFNFNYNSGVFSHNRSYGSASEVIAGRACILGIGTTVTSGWSSGTVAYPNSLSISPPLPANGYQNSTVSLGFFWSYWSGVDDDFEYDSTLSSNTLNITTSIGNSDSWAKASAMRLSLPKGYTVNKQSFTVSNGQIGTYSFNDDPSLGVNLVFASAITYHTCGDDDFSYGITCGNTSCTVSTSGGAACSYVSGYITQIQWIDNL